jgi:hypothetical protein
MSVFELDSDLDNNQMVIVYLDCYPVHTGNEFRYYIFKKFPYIILCFVPANCEYPVTCCQAIKLMQFSGTGKLQPANIGLNCVIKH